MSLTDSVRRSPTMSAAKESAGLLSLPLDILVLLPGYLHNIEDLMNAASSCKTLRACVATATPNTILKLAAAQSNVFFRPSPHFLATATARELGNWARKSIKNEQELAKKMKQGVEGVMELALDHCGLTMERIRELHSLRFSVINPVEDIIDKCVGSQWYATPGFWSGAVDDAYTIAADPSETVFHLAMYGELFAPDFETILDNNRNVRTLSVDTRLEFIKYCLPDEYTRIGGMNDSSIDPRRVVEETGPYVQGPDGRFQVQHTHNLALTWLIKSGRFKPRYAELRAKAGLPEFEEDFDDGWWYHESHYDRDWRQRLWETIMMCQGLDGLGMLRPDMQQAWFNRIREWRDKIAKLEREPPMIKVGRQATLEYPFLLGDLRICMSGYVPGS
ncbi:hypothetical protein F4808DRAFT_421170 [Astrocystis sublimbata]|nr:hypothetical protein F4808DRAFT_421170 [Astrocystis sublimbata]